MPREKGRSQLWLWQDEEGTEPEQGLGFGITARVLPPPGAASPLPRELVDLSVDVLGPGCLKSLLFSERWEGEAAGDGLRALPWVPCSAPPEMPQRPWAWTPQIPARRCHGWCSYSSNTSRVLLPPDWDEPEAAEAAPRGEILSSTLKREEQDKLCLHSLGIGEQGDLQEPPSLWSWTPPADGVMTSGTGE